MVDVRGTRSKKRLGECLLERGLISPDQLTQALQAQRRRGLRLGRALVELGYLTEEQLLVELGGLLGLRAVDIQQLPIDRMALDVLSARFVAENEVFPLELKQSRGRRVLVVAMSDPTNYRVTDELSFMTDATIEPVLAKASAIERAIREHYGARLHAMGIMGPFGVSVDHPSSMTIVRPGGTEEIIRTRPVRPVPSTNDAVSNAEPTAIMQNPSVTLKEPIDVAERSLLLVEEVTAPIPVDDLELSALPTEIPSLLPEQVDLGALVDLAGGTVDAEAFQRLERRFWALLRALVSKGVITREEFLNQLQNGGVE